MSYKQFVLDQVKDLQKGQFIAADLGAKHARHFRATLSWLTVKQLVGRTYKTKTSDGVLWVIRSDV